MPPAPVKILAVLAVLNQKVALPSPFVYPSDCVGLFKATLLSVSGVHLSSDLSFRLSSACDLCRSRSWYVEPFGPPFQVLICRGLKQKERPQRCQVV